jgi:hypothetical protein
MDILILGLFGDKKILIFSPVTDVGNC